MIPSHSCHFIIIIISSSEIYTTHSLTDLLTHSLQTASQPAPAGSQKTTQSCNSQKLASQSISKGAPTPPPNNAPKHHNHPFICLLGLLSIRIPNVFNGTNNSLLDPHLYRKGCLSTTSLCSQPPPLARSHIHNNVLYQLC